MELQFGATSTSHHKFFKQVQRGYQVLAFDQHTAVEAGRIFQALRIKNKLIDMRDIMIAATEIVHDLQLVTLNGEHFSRVKGLSVIAEVNEIQ